MKTPDPIEDKALEDIKKDEKVKRALSENSVSIQMENADTLKKGTHIIGVTAIIFLICLVFYLLLRWERVQFRTTTFHWYKNLL